MHLHLARGIARSTNANAFALLIFPFFLSSGREGHKVTRSRCLKSFSFHLMGVHAFIVNQLLNTYHSQRNYLKMKYTTYAAFALISLASVHAATVTYSTYTATGAADTSWVMASTGVASVNFGGFDTIFGGVNWEGTQSNGHPAGQTYADVAGFAIYHSIPGSAWASNAFGLYPTDPSVGLLDSGTLLSGAGMTIDINGLTNGQAYMAKFIFANSNAGSAGNTMNLTSAAGNTGSSGAAQYAFADGKFLVVTATWTADGFGDSFVPSINGGANSILNAVQIVAVPEPSAMLLASIGGLFLIRRRR